MSDPQDTASAEPARSDWERKTLEQLAFATLREQQTARRWKNGLRLAWLLFALLVFWLGWSYNAPTASPSMPHTAMVAIKGEITPEGDASAENIMAAMRSALEDTGSRALVLLINSPGGSPVQAGLINDEIHRLKKLHGKPVYAVVEESCASAAYYIAAAADQIYVDKAGRGDRLKESSEMFSGLFWTGQQAVDMGLADALGSLDSVARDVVKASEVIDYTRHENVAERLAKRFGAAMGEASVKALRQGMALR